MRARSNFVKEYGWYTANIAAHFLPVVNRFENFYTSVYFTGMKLLDHYAPRFTKEYKDEINVVNAGACIYIAFTGASNTIHGITSGDVEALGRAAVDLGSLVQMTGDAAAMAGTTRKGLPKAAIQSVGNVWHKYVK